MLNYFDPFKQFTLRKMKKVLTLFAVFAAAVALPADYQSNFEVPAEELEGDFQGDMIISQQELDAFNGRIDENLRWRNNIVPYWVNTTFFSRKIVFL